MAKCRSILGAGLALVLVLVGVGCQRSLPPRSTPMPTPAPTVPAVPPDATVLKETEIDGEGNGQVERTTVYQQDSQIGIVMAPTQGAGEPWRKTLPADSTFIDLSNKDMDADGRPEILLETRGPEADMYNLYIIRWRAGQGEILAPVGGPSAGSESLRSKDYRPYIDDLDSNGSWEVAVSVFSPKNLHFLDTVVYQWDGQAYAQTDFYLMPPRVVPAATATPATP